MSPSNYELTTDRGLFYNVNLLEEVGGKPCPNVYE